MSTEDTRHDEFPFSWYLGTQEPRTILIGPAGHDCEAWKELERVATESRRWVNPFYMEAECACVLRRHAITVAFEERVKQSNSVYHAHISYGVPGVAKEDPKMTPAFVSAYEQFRKSYTVK